MVEVILYTKENCHLCMEAEQLLSILDGIYSFQLIKRDIYSNDEWLEKYLLEIPVIEINEEKLFNEQISYESLEKLLNQPK